MAATSRNSIAKSWRAKRHEPVTVRLTVRFKFGESKNDTMTMIDDREISMVGGVLEYRDRIMRGFATLLLRAAAAKPGLTRELLPLSGLLRKQRGKRS